jgi:hypothetical protein
VSEACGPGDRSGREHGAAGRRLEEQHVGAH